MRPTHTLLRRTKKLIGRLQDNAAEANRIIFLRIQKCLNRIGRSSCVVAPERRIHPIFRKKNIAGPLNFPEQVQRSTQVPFGRSGAQRMMQIP